MFFTLSTEVLVVTLFGIVLGATAIGLVIGRAVRARSEEAQDSFGVLQGALLGFMALVLAFGLSLAVGRYESRRATTVTEATALGTTYLRAQTLAEPMRSESMALLEEYTELGIRIADVAPDSASDRPSTTRRRTARPACTSSR
jgi:type II secretory pathway pseudopilin PulG